MRPSLNYIVALISLYSLLFASPDASANFQTRNQNELGSQTIPAFPARGYFDTTFLPGGTIHASARGDLFLGGQTFDLFRSTNNGFSWSYLPDPVYWAGNSVLAISPNYDLDGTIFRGLDYGNNAFLYSRDRGLTWHTPAQLVVGPVVDLDVSPGFSSDRTVYLVTLDYQQVWLRRSTDGGESFSPLPKPSGASSIHDLELSLDFSKDHKVFVRLADSTLWRSPDGGLNWQRADSGISTGSHQDIFDLEIASMGGKPVLFVSESDGIKYSVDEGDTWIPVNLPEPETKIIQLSAVYFPDSKLTEIWAQEKYDPLYGYNHKRLFHTLDFGVSWNIFSYIHPLSSMAFSPLYTQDKVFYVNTAEELWKTTDHGSTWQLLSRLPSRPSGDGYSDFDQLELVKTPDFHGVSHLFAYPASVQIGSFPQGSSWFQRSLDNGVSWETLPLPKAGAPVKFVVAPTYPAVKTIFAGIGNSFFRSDDAGQTWKIVSEGLPFPFEYMDISPTFNLDRILYAGGYTQGVYRSTDGGVSWMSLPDLGTFIYGIDFSPTYAQDQTIFINTASSIKRSQDGGQVWNNIGMGGMLLAVSPDYANDGVLFAGNQNTTSGNLFRSTDRGETWEELTGFSPYDFFHTIALSPDYAHDQTLIIGINCRPLYISEDAGATWYELAGLPLPCGYRKSADVMLTHQGKLLQPVVSTVSSIFTYHWPNDLQNIPSTIVFTVPQGSTLPVQRSLRLSSSQGAGARWELLEDLDWLSATPVVGTLPSEIILTVEPSLISGDPSSHIALKAFWSQRQSVTFSVNVRVFFYIQQVFLPMVSQP